MSDLQKYIWEHKNWTEFTWDSDVLLPVLGQVRQMQGKMLARVKPLQAHLTTEAQIEILIEEAVQTSAIEGEVLNRESVRSSISRHLGLNEAGLRSVERYVDGLVDVLLDSTQNYHTVLSAKRIKSWQAALFPTGYSGLHKIRTGQWRKEAMQIVSGAIGRERVHFQAPSASVLDQEMKKFLHWWKVSEGEGLLRAGIAHFWFVTIHPFDDGNGRIARAITDMALAQDEESSMRCYSVSSQMMHEWKSYYDNLEKSSKASPDLTDWLLWFLECLKRSMQRSEVIIKNVLAKAEFWQHYAQRDLNDRQRKVINRLLDAGQGQFEGGLTTRKYVSLTKVSRATAFREINELLNQKIIVKDMKAQGRSIRYDVNWNFIST